MSLARLLRFPRAPRTSAVLAGPLADRSEPALRGSGPRPPTATVSGSAGMTKPPRRGSFAASSRPGTTRISGRSPPTSNPGGSSLTSVRRSARRSSRPTATRSATAAGCSCTTATSPSSHASSATWCWRSTNRSIPRSPARRTPSSLFYLALTFGLQDDPPEAVARAIGLVEQVGHDKGIKFPFQGTIATTDGERMWAFRYSSEGKSRSLFFSGNVATLRQLYPDREIFQEVSEDSRLVVSEPIGDLPGPGTRCPSRLGAWSARARTRWRRSRSNRRPSSCRLAADTRRYDDRFGAHVKWDMAIVAAALLAVAAVSEQLRA